MSLEPLKGRLIAELIPVNERMSHGGLILIDRKNITNEAIVVAVGADSMNRNGKVLKPPAQPGDKIFFKKYTPMTHEASRDGHKTGLITIWWGDIYAVEQK